MRKIFFRINHVEEKGKKQKILGRRRNLFHKYFVKTSDRENSTDKMGVFISHGHQNSRMSQKGKKTKANKEKNGKHQRIKSRKKKRGTQKIKESKRKQRNDKKCKRKKDI